MKCAPVLRRERAPGTLSRVTEPRRGGRGQRVAPAGREPDGDAGKARGAQDGLRQRPTRAEAKAALTSPRPVDAGRERASLPHNPRSTATEHLARRTLSAPGPRCSARYSPDSPNDLLEGAILVSRLQK